MLVQKVRFFGVSPFLTLLLPPIITNLVNRKKSLLKKSYIDHHFTNHDYKNEYSKNKKFYFTFFCVVWVF